MKSTVKIFPFLFVFIAAQAFSQTENLDALASRLNNHVAVLAADSLEGRGLGTDGKVVAAEYISDHFQEIGLQPYDENGYYQQFMLRLGSAMIPGTNVVGYLEGSDPDLKDEFILIGAHFDHLGYEMKDGEKVIYNGADDNASGVASVIELARYLAPNQQKLKRSILFVAFDGEESGLLGSFRFRDENTLVPMDAVKMMFSLDMLGMYETHKGLDLIGIGIVDGAESIAEKWAEKRQIELKNVSAELAARTDTWPFGEVGIPAVHGFTGLKSPYHKPEDTYEKLDYEGMAAVNVFLGDLLTELSAIPVIEPSKKFLRLQKPAALTFDAGLTAYTGSSKHKLPSRYYSADGIFSYAGGVFLQMHVGKKITLQPEILYASTGSQSPFGNLRQSSVMVPVNLHYNLINQYGGMVKVWPLIGGYYAYSFDGKHGSQDINDLVFSHQEYGMNLGFGFDAMQWQIKWFWQRSLSNATHSPDPKLFRSGWFLTVGYRF